MTCPVCGYDNLPFAPADYNICPSCGTEFGYDDFTASHAELRMRWLQNGAPWFSQSTPRPPGWNALDQISRSGLGPRCEAGTQTDPQVVVLPTPSALVQDLRVSSTMTERVPADYDGYAISPAP
jgi:hypothetical protein